MITKPSYQEIRDFTKFLNDKGFEANDRFDPNAFYLYLSYGYIFVRIDYTLKNEFKYIKAKLCLDWGDGLYGKPKFPRVYDFGKPVKSLDKDFVNTCIMTANDVMGEIAATIQKVESIIDLSMSNFRKNTKINRQDIPDSSANVQAVD